MTPRGRHPTDKPLIALRPHPETKGPQPLFKSVERDTPPHKPEVARRKERSHAHRRSARTDRGGQD